MARCIDCWHYDVCKHKLDELCKWTKIEDLIHNCTKFKDRTKYAEVVRCKDCKHWEQTDGLLTYWECNIFSGIHDNGYPTNADDFCSYGERREGE